MSWNPKDIPVERLSSLDETGKRVFLYPDAVKGYYQRLRKYFYWFLLILFLVLPWTTYNGEQTLLLDLAERRFVFFGAVFWAHDAPLVFFPLILAALGLVFVTSVWGRVWCGWGCPQTVFLESLFRPIERLIEGSYIKRMKLDKAPWSLSKAFKKAVKWFLFFIVSSHIAHSFTAYFFGAKKLFWTTLELPTESWALFIFVQVFTLVLLFDFGWFREQFCIIMCPYGRFQSVLMGRQSLAVLYDEKRGEPRKGTAEGDGDCVNCYRCVAVCPTGIDIRRGVQMECIACTACIDACDEIMEKVKKPKGLIKYASVSQMADKTRKLFTKRSATYLTLLGLILITFITILNLRKELDLKVIRAIETPYNVVGGTVVNHFRLVVVNQSQASMQIEKPKLSFAEVVSPELPLVLKPGESKRVHFFIKSSLNELSERDENKVQMSISYETKGKVRSIENSLSLLSPNLRRETK